MSGHPVSLASQPIDQPQQQAGVSLNHLAECGLDAQETHAADIAHKLVQRLFAPEVKRYESSAPTPLPAHLPLLSRVHRRLEDVILETSERAHLAVAKAGLLASESGRRFLKEMTSSYDTKGGKVWLQGVAGLVGASLGGLVGVAGAAVGEGGIKTICDVASKVIPQGGELWKTHEKSTEIDADKDIAYMQQKLSKQETEGRTQSETLRRVNEAATSALQQQSQLYKLKGQ